VVVVAAVVVVQHPQEPAQHLQAQRQQLL